MANDYVTVLLTMVMAYQISGPQWDRRLRSALSAVAMGILGLGGLLLLPALTFEGLRLGWTISGVTLCGYATRSFVSRRVRRAPWLSVLDGAGAWAALVLSGASPLAVAAGAVAGGLLPLAVGPWPAVLKRFIEPLEVVLMGAVGLRILSQVLLGPELEAWPLLLFAVPWLVIWDWRAAARPAQ